MDRMQQWTAGALGALVIVAGKAVLCDHLGTEAADARRSQNRASGKAATIVEAAQRLNRASGIIATSILLDSAIEHYRGSFRNKAMMPPIVVSALVLAVRAHGTADNRKAAHRVRDSIYAGAAVTGLIGTGFHLYNIGNRPGGFSWQNLLYGSPMGAPAAVELSGLLGYCSERLRESHSCYPRVFGFRTPFMFVPVTVPSAATMLLVETAASHPKPVRPFTPGVWCSRPPAVSIRRSPSKPSPAAPRTGFVRARRTVTSQGVHNVSQRQ